MTITQLDRFATLCRLDRKMTHSEWREFEALRKQTKREQIDTSFVYLTDKSARDLHSEGSQAHLQNA